MRPTRSNARCTARLTDDNRSHYVQTTGIPQLLDLLVAKLRSVNSICQILNEIEDVLPAMRIFLPRHCILLGQFPDVGSGNKSFLPGSGKDNDAHHRVVLMS